MTQRQAGVDNWCDRLKREKTSTPIISRIVTIWLQTHDNSQNCCLIPCNIVYGSVNARYVFRWMKLSWLWCRSWRYFDSHKISVTCTISDVSGRGKSGHLPLLHLSLGLHLHVQCVDDRSITKCEHYEVMSTCVFIWTRVHSKFEWLYYFPGRNLKQSSWSCWISNSSFRKLSLVITARRNFHLLIVEFRTYFDKFHRILWWSPVMFRYANVNSDN